MSELSTYQYQLSQVDEILAKDPDNEEMRKLKADLQELISLYSNLNSGTATEKTTAKAATKRSATKQPGSENIDLTVGSTVEAKWSGDGQFYPAIVQEVTSTGAVVVFVGYNNQETVLIEDIRKPTSSSDAAAANEVANPVPSVSANGTDVSSVKTTSTTTLSNKPSSKSKTSTTTGAPKRQALFDDIGPKVSTKKAKLPPPPPSKVVQESAKAWQSFATKKKIKNKDSIFRTSEDPNARVGYTGSGKGMTKFEDKKKWVFGKE